MTSYKFYFSTEKWMEVKKLAEQLKTLGLPAFTLSGGVGLWHGVVEDSWTLEVVTSSILDVKSIAEQIGRMFHQTGVMVTWTPVECTLIPTGIPEEAPLGTGGNLCQIPHFNVPTLSRSPVPSWATPLGRLSRI